MFTNFKLLQHKREKKTLCTIRHDTFFFSHCKQFNKLTVYTWQLLITYYYYSSILTRVCFVYSLDEFWLPFSVNYKSHMTSCLKLTLSRCFSSCILQLLPVTDRKRPNVICSHTARPHQWLPVTFHAEKLHVCFLCSTPASLKTLSGVINLVLRFFFFSHLFPLS